MPNWRLPAPCSLPSIVLLPASSKSLLLSHMNMHAVSFSARPMPLLAVMIESPSPPPRTIRLDYVSRRRRWRGARGRRGCCLPRTTKKTHQGTKTSQASTFTGAGAVAGSTAFPCKQAMPRPPHEQKRKGRLRWRVPRLHRLLASLPCTTCSVYGV